MHFHYKDQMIIAVYGNDLYLFYESHGSDKYTMLENQEFFNIKARGRYSYHSTLKCYIVTFKDAS